jgi:hypothetical protein
MSGLPPSIRSRPDEVRIPSIRSGSGSPVRLKSSPMAIAVSSKTWFCVLMSMYWPGDGQSCGMLIPGERSHRIVSRLGLG